MSELVVGSIAGLAANSYVVDVAAGSTLDLSNGAVFPAGNVIQVVHFGTATNTSTTSTSYVDTALTASITPSSTSSKIVIIASIAFFRQNVTQARMRLYRGDTSTGTALGGSDFALSFSSVSQQSEVPATMNWVDSPATTSAVTYTVGLKTDNASYAAQVASQQSMILMEVAG